MGKKEVACSVDIFLTSWLSFLEIFRKEAKHQRGRHSPLGDWHDLFASLQSLLPKTLQERNAIAEMPLLGHYAKNSRGFLQAPRLSGEISTPVGKLQVINWPAVSVAGQRTVGKIQFSQVSQLIPRYPLY